jgi:hypothetical protein
MFQDDKLRGRQYNGYSWTMAFEGLIPEYGGVVTRRQRSERKNETPKYPTDRSSNQDTATLGTMRWSSEMHALFAPPCIFKVWVIGGGHRHFVWRNTSHAPADQSIIGETLETHLCVSVHSGSSRISSQHAHASEISPSFGTLVPVRIWLLLLLLLSLLLVAGWLLVPPQTELTVPVEIALNMSLLLPKLAGPVDDENVAQVF